MYDHPKLPNYSQNLFSSKCSFIRNPKRISVRVRQYNFKVPICSVFVWMLYLIQCYSHKWPRTWWFITSEMYSLIVWGSQRSKIRVTLGLCSLRRLWGRSFCGSFWCSGLQAFLGLLLHDLSFCLKLSHAPSSVSLSPSLPWLWTWGPPRSSTQGDIILSFLT